MNSMNSKHLLTGMKGIGDEALMIADPQSALEIAKIIANKVISIGVPLVEEIFKEAVKV